MQSLLEVLHAARDLAPTSASGLQAIARAPALATGNSLVVKPAEQASLTMLRTAELALEAGLPEGVLNVVPGLGEKAGKALALHMDVDAIVFTAGIGENSAMCRQRTLQRLDYLGARLDDDLNRDAHVSHASPVAEVSHRHSRVRLLVVKTDEVLEALGHHVLTDEAARWV